MGLDAGAYYDPQNMVLAVDPNYSDSEAFGAIAAEIAHARFHNRGFNWEYSRESCELSAQSVVLEASAARAVTLPAMMRARTHKIVKMRFMG